MAKQPSKKSRYKSNYAPETYVTPAQYLAELMCERIAKKEKKTLSERFWNQPEWAKQFKLQLVHANKLLEDYSCPIVLAVLNSARASRIFSLGANYVLRPLLEAEAKKALIVQIEVEPVVEEIQAPTRPKKKSLYDRLI